MGESDRYQDYRPQRRRLLLGDTNNALVGLFVLNIIFFVLLQVLRAVYGYMQGPGTQFTQEVLPQFMLPAEGAELAAKPWTLLTFMFTHIGVLELIGNMLWLWAFGYIFQELTGNRKLIPVYIYGGLAGALVFVLSVNLMPATRGNAHQYWLLGGYASNMALAVATATLAPDYRFFRNLGGGIPVWVLALVYLFIDFAGMFSQAAAYSLAHIGGAAAGFLFVFLIRRGIDAGAWMNRFYDWITHLFSPGRPGGDNVREKVFYNTRERRPYRKTSHVTQQRVDEILDKINQKGYHFLTEEEKNILRRASEEDL